MLLEGSRKEDAEMTKYVYAISFPSADAAEHFVEDISETIVPYCASLGISVRRNGRLCRVETLVADQNWIAVLRHHDGCIVRQSEREDAK
jgi:hypothetical protein